MCVCVWLCGHVDRQYVHRAFCCVVSCRAGCLRCCCCSISACCWLELRLAWWLSIPSCLVTAVVCACVCAVCEADSVVCHCPCVWAWLCVYVCGCVVMWTAGACIAPFAVSCRVGLAVYAGCCCCSLSACCWLELRLARWLSAPSCLVHAVLCACVCAVCEADSVVCHCPCGWAWLCVYVCGCVVMWTGSTCIAPFAVSCRVGLAVYAAAAAASVLAAGSSCAWHGGCRSLLAL